MFKVRENCYVPEIFFDVCCNQDVNGEHSVLKKIISQSPDKSAAIFDIGARNSKFPTFSDTHSFHLFDPKFIYEPGVDYSKSIINEAALNSTDCTLDSYCEKNNIDSVEFIKIDTDGYDIDVLQGAINTIKKTKYIQIEYDIFYLFHKLDVSLLYKLLEGFLIYKVTPFGLIKVDSIKENYIYSNYLFSREEFSIDPPELNEEFFKGIFYEIDPGTIKSAFEKVDHPFYKEPMYVDTKQFLRGYFAQYLPGFINTLPL